MAIAKSMNILGAKSHFNYVSHNGKTIYGVAIPFKVVADGKTIDVGIGFTDAGQVYYVQYPGDDFPLTSDMVCEFINLNIKNRNYEISEVNRYSEVNVFAMIDKNGKVSIIEDKNIFDDADTINVIKLIEEKAKFINLLIDSEFEGTFEDMMKQG